LHFDYYRGLDAALHWGVGLQAYEYEIPDNLCSVELPGDWIFRAEVSHEAKLRALEVVLAEEFKRSVRFEERPAEDIVVVGTGRWKFHPVYDTYGIQIFAGSRRPEIEEYYDWDYGEADSISQFLEMLGSIVGVRIIDRTDNIQKMEIPFDIYQRRTLIRSLTDLKEKRQRLEALLANVTAQTELQFEIQTRPGHKWVVTEEPR